MKKGFNEKERAREKETTAKELSVCGLSFEELLKSCYLKIEYPI